MAARHWEQLAIPAGFPTGSLFGRAGRNIHEVRAHTGVKRIDIDTLAGTIDLWGPTAASVAAAADVYRRLFANAGGLSCRHALPISQPWQQRDAPAVFLKASHAVVVGTISPTKAWR